MVIYALHCCLNSIEISLNYSFSKNFGPFAHALSRTDARREVINWKYHILVDASCQKIEKTCHFWNCCLKLKMVFKVPELRMKFSFYEILEWELMETKTKWANARACDERYNLICVYSFWAIGGWNLFV